MDLNALIAELKQIRTPHSRRRRVDSWVLAGGWSLSDVLLCEDLGVKTEIMESLTGTTREGGIPRSDPSLRPDIRFKLRTIDGEPLGRIRMGPDPRVRMTTRQQRTARMRGEVLDLYREFGAEFDVDITAASRILNTCGYGIHTPRFENRNAELRDERDAHGRPVLRRDTWRVVEVGSLQERLAANERGETVAASKREAKAR